MSIDTDIDCPEWPEILRACQTQLQGRMHTALPGIVKSYSNSKQTADVQLAVQLQSETVPMLAGVPVLHPGGAAGFLHVPLAEGDTCLVVFSEEDPSKWLSTGSISAPAVLQRHGLHAIAIPGLRPATAPLAVTGGHVTLGVASELRLGSNTASDPVALKSLVEQAIADLLDGIISAAGSISGPGGGPAVLTALNAFKLSYLGTLAVGATKVKAE